MSAGARRGIALLAVAAVMAILLLAGLVVVVMIQRPPRVVSVVLVVLDTVRADRCSSYGHSRATTPRLDRLAAEGLRFEHARAPAPWTLPSHASLFTGLLPHQHGCHWEHRWLADSQGTIAEMVAEKGFATFGVTTNPNASSLYHLDQGFTTFVETWRLREAHRGRSDSSIANAEIRRFLERRDRAQPFFLFVNYSDAHLPYAPPPPADRLFGDPGERARRLAARGDLLQATLVGEERIEPDDAAGLGLLYDGDVRTADERLGELVDLLQAHGLSQDTVLIVTSDHGEHLGEEGKVDHQLSLDEALLRVPLVVRWPRMVRPAVVPEPVALTDVKGWIAAIADRRLPAWSPPPDLAPDAFVAQQLRPVDLAELVRARGGDAALLDRRRAALFRPDEGGGWKLVLVEPLAESFRRVDARGVERETAEPPLAGELRDLLSARLLEGTFFEDEHDLAPAAIRDESGLAELRQLGYAAGATGTGDVGVHAAEHWSAGLRDRARGEFELARRELVRALALAPDEPGLRLALEEVKREAAR